MPDSLPYGGTHRGVDAYVALLQRIGGLVDLQFAIAGLHALDNTTVLLRMHVTFTARATGRSRRLPVFELLTVQANRVTTSHVFVADAAALLRTLDPTDPPHPTEARRDQRGI